MKTTKLIPSSDDETKPPLDEARKKYNKDKLLEQLIKQLQRKQLSKQDVKLLEVLGFSETLQILMEERTQMDKHNDHLNQIAGLDGMMQDQQQTYRRGNDYKESPMLGGTQKIYSNLKRSSKAYKHSKAW